MELNPVLFQSIIDDLEQRNAEVLVNSYVNSGRLWDFQRQIDYTIQARFPNGKLWEIVGIEDANP